MQRRGRTPDIWLVNMFRQTPGTDEISLYDECLTKYVMCRDVCFETTSKKFVCVQQKKNKIYKIN